MARPVAFPDHYCWFLLAGALDVVITWVVLHFGGDEVNPIAYGALQIGGVWGLVLLKFTTAAIVIAVCEVLAVRHPLRARWLATVAVGIAFMPPTLGAAQIAGHALA
ncbi:MAG: hypothetical protein KIT68_08485 [Phycisphaeraceae bacterium]|nr:hypothetical protein [Phycisphaeraceae bacterium]